MIRSAFVAMLAGSSWLLCLTAPCSAQKPNIVLMLADNLGYGDVGFLYRGSGR